VVGHALASQFDRLWIRNGTEEFLCFSSTEATQKKVAVEKYSGVLQKPEWNIVV